MQKKSNKSVLVVKSVGTSIKVENKCRQEFHHANTKDTQIRR